MGYSRTVGFLVALVFVAATVAVAEERDPLQPRVPPDQIVDAKKMKAPYGDARGSDSRRQRTRSARR